MVPKYCYQVVCTYRVGADNKLKREVRNYETLPGAVSYRDSILRKQNVRTVQICMILDETHKGVGDD